MWNISRPGSPLKKSTTATTNTTTTTTKSNNNNNEKDAQNSGKKDHMNMKSVQDSLPDIHMATAKGFPTSDNIINFNNMASNNLKLGGGGGIQDVHMETLKKMTAKKPGSALQLWERELLEAPEVKRKATVAQLCEFLSLFLICFPSLVRPSSPYHPLCVTDLD